MAQAITNAMVAKLYLATFGRPLDSEGLSYWGGDGIYSNGQVTSLTSMEQIAQSFFDQAETQATYPDGTSTESFITSIYDNLFERTPDTQGLAYWKDQLDGTNDSGLNPNLNVMARETMILAVINGAQDTVDGNDASMLQNRADVALYLAEQGTLTGDMAQSSTVINAVYAVNGDSTAQEITDAQTAADAAVIEVNTAPELAAMDAISQIENVTLTAGTVIATAAATDADGQTLTYSLTGDSRFAIDASTGAVSVIADTTFDYEAETSVTLTVTATDGIESSTTDLTLNITDVAASYAMTPASQSVNDGDTVEFTFTAVESDATEVTYTITGVDAADVVGGANSLTGTATLTDGEATISVTLRADAADGVAETMTATASVDSTVVATATATVADTSASATTTNIGLTEIAVANDANGGAGVFITKEAGDTGTVNYTIASNGDASVDASVIFGGDANLNITSGSGDDSIIIDGDGNNVVDAGDGVDSIILGNGNNVVVIGDAEFDGASSIIGGTGVNTVVVSGTNSFNAADFTNIQHLVIEDGADITLDEDLVAELTSITVNGTTAELTIADVADDNGTAAGTDTLSLDLTDVLSGSLASLTVGTNTNAKEVEVQLSTAQIENIAAFTVDAGSNIIADAEGTALVIARGGSATTEVGTVTLEAAMTQDLAEESNLSFTMSLTASELYDQLYLGDNNVNALGDNTGTAADQITNNQGAGSNTVEVTITDSATVAQMVAFINAGVTFAAPVNVSDTAANIVATLDGAGQDTTGTGWLSEDNVATLTITTAATVAEADDIFKAGGDLAVAVAASTTDTLTTPTYTISDTSANVAAAYNDTDVTNATSVVLTDAATVAEATNLVGLANLSGGYDLSDTPSNLYGASTAVRNGATDITTITTDATVVQAGKILTYSNTGDTTIHNLTDTALKLYNASTATLDAATVVEITGAGVTDREVTVAQLTKIAPYLAEGYTLEIKDTAANLSSAAGLAIIEQFDVANVLVTPTDDLTLAQYNAIAAVVDNADFGLLNGANAYEIADTAANIIDATDDQETDALGNNAADTAANTANVAILNGVTTQVTVTDATTVANMTTIDAETTATLVYSLSDTAANIATDIGVGDYTDGATAVTITTAATAADAVTLKGDASHTHVYAISDTLANIAAQVGEAALTSATSITSTNDTVTVALAQDVVTINTALTGASKSTLSYAVSDSVTNFTANLTNDTTQADIDLLTDATSVHMTGTGAAIKTYDTTAATDGLFDLVDTYAIEIDSDSVGSALSTDIAAAPTYYDGAATVTVTTADLTVANADADHDILIADSNDDKLVFADISDVASAFTGADADAQTAIGLATQASVTDGVSVSTANTIDAMVSGTLLLENTVTDTAANLLTAATVFTAVEAGSGDIAVSDNATVAQYETLIDMVEAAGMYASVLAADVTEFDATISDTITNVQGASADLLSTLGDTTSDNAVNLKAGSEVSLTVAQAAALVNEDDFSDGLNDINDSTGSDATYEIVDTIDNIVNAIAGNGDALTSALTNASTIIATAGTTIPGTYMADLVALSAAANFDAVNSVYNISATFAQLDNTNSAVANATAVTVTDAVTYANAATAYGYNSAITFSGGLDSADFSNFITITSGVAAYNGTTEEAIVTAAGKVVDLQDDSLSVAEASAIVTLLGEDATVTYSLSDTAANLAAAGTTLANATAITVTDNATVAQIEAINTDATHTSFTVASYDVVDTAANLAANTTVAVAANSAALTASTTATMAEAITLETAFATTAANTKEIALDVADTAANVVANIATLVAIDDAGADENFDESSNDTISLTTTATLAQAAVLDGYAGNIDTAANVLNSNTAFTDGYYVSDTAANLLNAANIAGYSEADAVVVTDTVNVSTALQIADLVDANSDAAITQAQAIAKMTFSIDDGVEYIIAALAEDNALLGAAASVSVDGTAITLHENRDSGTFHVAGSVAELNALPASLLANDDGYVIIDTLENYANAGTLATSDDKADHIIVDTSENITAADISVTGAAEEVRVTDVITVATLDALQALALDISTVAGVSDTATNLAAGTLGGALLDIAAITVTDTTVTDAQVDAIVTAQGVDADSSIITYNLSDEYDNMNTAAIITNAATVVVTDAITSAEANTIYALNTAITMTVEDTAANTAGVIITGTDTSKIDALNAAAVVTCTDADVTVAEAAALIGLSGFDGTYTLSDTAANLAAADSTLLANAVEVQVSTAATVAEAAILSVLANIDTTTVSTVDYANFTVTDTAANIAAADASLLDNVATITFAAGATDDDVTAAQAQALYTLDQNSAVIGLDLTADTADLVDTFANITNASNANGVAAAANTTVTDAITVANASTVITAASGSTTVAYDLSDTRSHLQGATSTVYNKATSVVVTDDVTAAQATIINSIYDGNTAGISAASDISFGKVTGTYAELMASTNLLITQATTVDVTDAMTVAELADVDGTGFLNTVGTKLTGGYDVEDSVDNIVNAALNNDYSNAVVTNAANVSLTGSTTMNMAAAGVIMGLNFTGSYDLADTATEISAAATATINGADSVDVTFVDGVQENFDATAITTTVTLDMSTNEAVITQHATTFDLTDVDVLTLTSGTIYDIDLGTSSAAHNQLASSGVNALVDNDFSIYYGYRTGDGFVVSSTVVEDSMIVWNADAGSTDSDEYGVVFDGTATVTIESNLISGSANDTINLTTLSAVDTIVFASTAEANGADTISGFDVADTLDFAAFIGTTLTNTTAADFAAAVLDLTTNNVGFVYNKASLSASDIATGATTGKIAVADDGKAVVITNADADGAGIATDGSSDWKVYFIEDTDTGATQSWEVTLVGTISTNASIDTAGEMDGVTIA